MPNDAIQTLLTDCRTRLNAASAATGATKTIAEALTQQFDPLAREIQAGLPTATEAQRNNWETRLKELQKAIPRALEAGPADAASEMFETFASNPRIYTIASITIFFTALLIVLVLVLAKLSSSQPAGMPEAVASALPLVAVMGGLGGFLSCIQSFGIYVGNREFLRSWTIYYLLFPLKGAGLAIIVFFLIHTDIGNQNLNLGDGVAVAPAQTNAVMLASSPTANSASTTTSNNIAPAISASTNTPVARIELVTQPIVEPKKLNLVTACLVAALTGLFSNQAIEMLASVFAVIFKRVEGRDGSSTTSDPTAKSSPK